MAVRDAATARNEVLRFYDGHLLPDELMAAMSGDRGWFPVRQVLTKGVPRDLGPGGAPPDLRLVDGGRTFDLYDYISTNSIAALMVLKDGKLVFDYYRDGLTDRSLWLSCSLAKSIASMLVGIALADGHINSLDDPVGRYCDAGLSYAAVSLRHLLQMTTGVRWSEDYGDSTSDRRAFLAAQLAGQPGAMLTVMRSLGASTPPGQSWTYNTGESCLLGAVIEGATGRNLADLLADRLWPKIGAADPAWWWQETPAGTTVSGTGLYASLGDYVRFGQFALEAWEGKHNDLLSSDWMRSATTPIHVAGLKVDYGYMWWLPQHSAPGMEGSFQAEGIYGQFLHVNPARNLVALVASARAKPSARHRVEIDDRAFFSALSKL